MKKINETNSTCEHLGMFSKNQVNVYNKSCKKNENTQCVLIEVQYEYVQITR